MSVRGTWIIVAATILGLALVLPHSPIHPDAIALPTMNMSPRSGPMFPTRALTLLIPYAVLTFALRSFLRGRIAARRYLGLASLSSYLAILALSYTQVGDWTGIPMRVTTESYARDAYLFDSFDAIWTQYDQVGPMTGHGRTHPPGAVGLYWIAQEIGAGVVDGEREGYEAFVAGLLIAGFGLPLLALIWLFPLWAITARLYGDQAAAITVAFGAFVPTVIVIAPCIEALLLPLGASALYCLDIALERGAFRFTLLAGAFGVSGTFLSFAYGPSAAVLLGWIIWSFRPIPWGMRLKHVVVLVLGALSFAAVLSLVLGYDPIARFMGAIAHHAGVGKPRRDFNTFLLLSPLSFFLWIGFTITYASATLIPKDRLAALAFGTLTLLTLSGIVRGETERLWLAFLPFVVIPAGAALASEQLVDQSPREGKSVQVSWPVYAFLLAVTLASARVLDYGCDYFR